MLLSVTLPAAPACCSLLAVAPCCLLPCCAAAWLHFSSAANVSTQASKSLHPAIRPVGSFGRQSSVHTGALEAAKTALHCHMLAALCWLQRRRAGTRWRTTMRHVSDDGCVIFGKQSCVELVRSAAWVHDDSPPEGFDLDCIAPTCALQGAWRVATRRSRNSVCSSCWLGTTAGISCWIGRVLTIDVVQQQALRVSVSRLTDWTASWGRCA